MAKQQINTESLPKYIQLVDRLFYHWKIGPEDKSMLLGFETAGSELSSVFEQVLMQKNIQDIIERIACLLAIHENLRIIFPRNNNLAYGWMTAKCADFDGLTPIDVVKTHGTSGLNMLIEYLEEVKMI